MRDDYFYSSLTSDHVAEVGLQPRTSHSRTHALTLYHTTLEVMLELDSEGLNVLLADGGRKGILGRCVKS